MKSWQKNAFVAVVSAFILGLILVFVYGFSVLTHLGFYQVGFWIWILYIADKLYFKVKKAVDEEESKQ